MKVYIIGWGILNSTVKFIYLESPSSSGGRIKMRWVEYEQCIRE